MRLHAKAQRILALFQVESLLKGSASDAITFERIHGKDTKMIKAKDLDLHKFAPRGLPEEVRPLLDVTCSPVSMTIYCLALPLQAL